MMPRAPDRQASSASTTASPTAAAAGSRSRAGRLAWPQALRPRIPEPWRERASAFWSARNPREQALLGGGGAVLALVIVYSVLWEPAAEGRERLSRTLPQLRAELAEMETLAQEARGLSASPAPSLRGEALVNALREGMTQHGLSPTRLTAVGDNAVQVQFERVPFGAVASWLSGVREQQRLKVTETRIDYVGKTALVNVTATLQGPGANPAGRG